MAFIKTSDQEGCFRSEAVTHFIVQSIVEMIPGGNHYVTFIKMFSGNAQIAQHHWQGEMRLTYENIGEALARAERSRESVMTFDDLIKKELESTPKLSAVS
jgi:hypothetical protein